MTFASRVVVFIKEARYPHFCRYTFPGVHSLPFDTHTACLGGKTAPVEEVRLFIEERKEAGEHLEEIGHGKRGIGPFTAYGEVPIFGTDIMDYGHDCE